MCATPGGEGGQPRRLGKARDRFLRDAEPAETPVVRFPVAHRQIFRNALVGCEPFARLRFAAELIDKPEIQGLPAREGAAVRDLVELLAGKLPPLGDEVL